MEQSSSSSNLGQAQYNSHLATLMKLNRIAFGVKCYVRSTEKCRNLFEGLGMTPAEYLRPFGLMNKKFDFSSINSKKRLISNFQINFIDDREFRAPTKQQVEATMLRILETNTPNLSNIHRQFKTKEQVDQHLESSKTFWFDKCSEVVLEHCRFSHTFCFTDQPVYLINFLTVDESDPVRVVQQLEQESMQHLKEIFKNNPTELGNQNIPRANFIICDVSSKRQIEAAQQVQAELRSKFEYMNRIIPINSSNANIELSAWEPSLETRYYSSVSSSLDRKKKILAPEDFSKIQEIFHEFLIVYMLPNIDSKLKGYHQQYQSQKKNSISSTLKKLFNTNIQKPEQGGAYQMIPFESLVRNIADLLYLMHDYEQAIDFYKQCTEAFKSKSYRHYASAVEMMALCQVMLHHELKGSIQKNDVQVIFNSLTDAVNSYSYQVAHIHFSLRVLVFKMLAQNLYDKFDPIVNHQVQEVGVLIKEREDSHKQNHYPIFQVLLQEQFSIQNLKQKPIRYRKYCINIMYAGHQFGKCKLRLHALRCYLLIEKEYEDAQWSPLQEFLNKQLAKFFIEIADYDRSFQYIKKLMLNIHKRDSKEIHSLTMRDTATFLSAFERIPTFDFSAGLPVAEYIPLPEISQNNVDIVVPDEVLVDWQRWKFLTLPTLSQSGVISTIDKQMKELNQQMSWSEMGQHLLNRSSEKESMSRQEIERENCILKSFAALCVEDKMAAFDIRGAATTQVRIGYVDEIITLKIELTNPMKIAFKIEDFSLFYEFTPQGSTETSRASEFIKEEKKSLEIGAERKLLVSMKLVPGCAGFLTVKGLQWKLFKIPVVFEYDFKGKLMSDGKTRFNNFSNRIQIVESTGKLAVRAVDCDDKICFGEIKTLTFELLNEGTSSLSGIRLMFSEPYIYGMTHLDLEGVTIAPGKSIQQKLHIRSSSDKECAIRILFAYRAEGNKYIRYVRFAQTLVVKPSFKLKAIQQTLYDQNSILLKIEDDFQRNFLASSSQQLQQSVLSSRSTASTSSSSVMSIKKQQPAMNLLDLDLLTSEDSGAMPSNSSRPQEDFELKIHQVILVEDNWRFAALPYEVTSEEKAYFYNIVLKKTDATRRKMSHAAVVNLNEIDLLGGDDEEDVASAAAAAAAVNTAAKETVEFYDVQEKEMHYMNLDTNELVSEYKPIANFECDFNTIRNYINYDRKLIFDRYWDKDLDFDHPDLVLIKVAWTYRTPEKTFSGLHGLPRLRLNPGYSPNPKLKCNPLEVFPLMICLEYNQQIKHDFTIDPVCCVDVRVRIRNVLSSEKISFLFQSFGSDEQLSSMNDEQFPFFVWEGETDKCISGLEQQAETIVQLRACFTSGGLYSINRFKYSFYVNKSNKQVVDPSGQLGTLSDNKVDFKTYVPLDKEQYFVNIVSSN